MTLLQKTTPPIKSTKHPRKKQWDHLYSMYFKFRAIFDLQQSGALRLDREDGKKHNIGYSKKAKTAFYKWFAKHFGPGGEIEPSSIVPSQKEFDAFRGFAYMLHPDKALRGGTRSFTSKIKVGFTLSEYQKMTTWHAMTDQQRVVLSKEQRKFYETNKELYIKVRANINHMKRQGTL